MGDLWSSVGVLSANFVGSILDGVVASWVPLVSGFVGAEGTENTLEKLSISFSFGGVNGFGPKRG